MENMKEYLSRKNLPIEGEEYQSHRVPDGWCIRNKCKYIKGREGKLVNLNGLYRTGTQLNWGVTTGEIGMSSWISNFGPNHACEPT